MARANWGASFRVAEEVFWIVSSLVSAIVSEKNDMASSTNTIPRAKGPACRHSSRISMPMTLLLYGCRPLLTDVEDHGLLHQLAHRRALDARRLEDALHDRFAGRLLEQLVGALEHLPGGGLRVAQRVHHELQLDLARDARLLQHRRVARLRLGDDRDRIVHLGLEERLPGDRPGPAHRAGRDAALDALPAEVRSEERRVGKKCRSRWSP